MSILVTLWCDGKTGDGSAFGDCATVVGGTIDAVTWAATGLGWEFAEGEHLCPGHAKARREARA